MRDRPEPEANLSERAQTSTFGSPSEPAIGRELLADAIQHPATLLPLAALIACGIYLLLLSPVFGGGLWAITLLALSGVVAAASFVWRYVFRHAEEYARRERERMDLQDLELARSRQQELVQRRADLDSGFLRIDSAAGLKVLRELATGYEQLQPALRRQSETDPLSMSQVPALAKETYRRGLSVLSDALELMDVAKTPGIERIEREVAELEKELEASKGDETRPERLSINEDTLASHRQRLEMLYQLRLRVDQLLFQAHRCEASLHRTHFELAAIKTGSSETGVDTVIEALQGTITQVKEVQEELKKLGY